LVLIIFSITITLISPRVTSGINSVRLKTTSKRIATTLKYARNLAIGERRVYYVRALDGKLVIVSAEVDGPKRELRVPGQVEIKAPQGNTILFYPRGSSTGGFFEIHDKDSDAFYLVSVEPSTGKIMAEVM